MDHTTVQFNETCFEWFYLPWNVTSGLGPFPSLAQAGILANKLLCQRLLPHGYFDCNNTPGLWKHSMRLILFTLVVNNFGVKYVGKEHANHLISCIKKKYELTKDWTSDLYCGIKLKWDYNACTIDLSMPGYIKKVQQKYKIACPRSPNTAHTHLLWNKLSQSTSSATRGHLSQAVAWRNQGNPMSHRKHHILCLSGWHHSAHGTELHCRQTIQGNGQHNG